MAVLGVASAVTLVYGAKVFHEQYDDGMEYTLGIENQLAAKQSNLMSTIAGTAVRLTLQSHGADEPTPVANGFTEYSATNPHGVRFDAVAKLDAGGNLVEVAFASEAVPSLHSGIALASPEGDSYMPDIPALPPSGGGIANPTTAGWQTAGWIGAYTLNTVADYGAGTGLLGDSPGTLALDSADWLVNHFYPDQIAPYE